MKIKIDKMITERETCFIYCLIRYNNNNYLIKTDSYIFRGYKSKGEEPKIIGWIKEKEGYLEIQESELKDMILKNDFD